MLYSVIFSYLYFIFFYFIKNQTTIIQLKLNYLNVLEVKDISNRIFQKRNIGMLGHYICEVSFQLLRFQILYYNINILIV